MSRLRQVARVGLLGISLVVFSVPGFLWSYESGSASAAEEGQQEKEPANALLYKVINFVILAGALGFVLRKPAADFFRSRSASIQKSLEEGRKAAETSEAQLRAVEEKLQQLDSEIAAFKASAASEMEAERQRLKQAAAEESGRILDSARAQMESAVRAARLELKNYAAQQAVTLAAELIHQRLDESSSSRLVRQFAATLEGKELKN